MGNINKLWFERNGGGDWKHSKCQLDDDGGKRPFMIPFIHFLDSEYYWQLRLKPEDYPGYRPCGIYACDLNFNRLPIGEFMLNYPANWNLNVGNGGTRLLTFHDPQWWGPCHGLTQYDQDCCVIDLKTVLGTNLWEQWAYQAGDGHLSQVAFNTSFFFTLSYNNQTYDIVNNELPTGWTWAEPWPYRFISIPCGADLSQATVHISFGYIDSFPSPHQVTINSTIGLDGYKECCSAAWPTYSSDCRCYFELTPTQYANIDKVVVDASNYTGTAILTGTPSGIPYFSPATFHYQNGAGNWIVPIDCILDTATIQFYIGTTLQSVTLQENCVNHFGVRDLTCWRWEVLLCSQKGGAPISLYSEPYYCSDECATPTLQISSDYCGQSWDIFGKYDGFIFDVYGPDAVGDIVTGANLEPKNTLRIPAILRKLPSKFNFSRNDKCNNYRSEVTETYSLKGTMLFPPYFAEMCEGIMGGKKFLANGDEYKIVSETVFETVNIQGISALKLNVQLEKCMQRAYFDCECCVPAEGRAC